MESATGKYVCWRADAFFRSSSHCHFYSSIIQLFHQLPNENSISVFSISLLMCKLFPARPSIIYSNSETFLPCLSCYFTNSSICCYLENICPPWVWNSGMWYYWTSESPIFEIVSCLIDLAKTTRNFYSISAQTVFKGQSRFTFTLPINL